MRFTGQNGDLAMKLVIGDMRLGRANETLVYDGQGWVTCGDFREGTVAAYLITKRIEILEARLNLLEQQVNDLTRP